MEIARNLNQLWHSRFPFIGLSHLRMLANQLPPPKYYVAEYDGIYYASAIWTAPIARIFNGMNYYELRRFAIAPDAPRYTASRMLGWMIRDIRKTMPQVKRLISYQDTGMHTGTIYKASGWKLEYQMKNIKCTARPGRALGKSICQSDTPKNRWELRLK